jgi:pSer/pThr/pTyr-binding forkhead associated (FHA) protein
VIATLEILNSRTNTSRKVLIAGSYYTLGRCTNCSIPLADDQKLSRLHCSLKLLSTAIGDDFYRLIDGSLVTGQPSVNGVWVNNKRVILSHDLRHGDRIKIGSCYQITYLTLEDEILDESHTIPEIPISQSIDHSID